jgi:arginine exporter protein ArgO
MMESLPTRRQAYATCVVAALSIVACAGILGIAVLMAAPPAVVPLVAAVCIGCPMVLGWSVPTSIAVIRATGSRVDARAMQALRRHLDSLPETQHPLGL